METNVGVDGEKLSGGQKQITFLIRELIGDKKIFILDEPTSALDEKNKQLESNKISQGAVYLKGSNLNEMM